MKRFLGLGVAAVMVFAAAIAVVCVKDTKAEGGAWESLINGQIKIDKTIPKIEKGVVVGKLPKSVKLLEYIIADYKARIDKGEKDIFYSASAGVGKEDEDVSGIGYFRKDGGPIATYMLAFGSVQETWNAAVVLISYREKNGGLRNIRTTVRWSEKAKEWSLGTSDAAEPPAPPEEIKVIK